MFIDDLTIKSSYSWHQLNKLWRFVLIQIQCILKESENAQQYSMILVVERTDDFCQEIWEVLRRLFEQFDGCQDCLLLDKFVIAANAFEDFFVELIGQFWGAHLAQDAKGQADQVVVGVSQVDPDTVGGHHEEFGLLVEELGEAQVADSLLDEGAPSDELEALHLAEVGFLAGHVDKEELGDVPGSHVLFIFLSGQRSTAKLYRMTAISFWYSARSSAMVLQFRIRVTNSWSLLMVKYGLRFKII